jgi:thioredoxin 1
MAAASMLELRDDNFEAEVLRSELPTLVDFTATWCGPCRAIAPLIGELAERYRGRVAVGVLDVDRHPRIAAQYGIRSIPALLLFKGGRVVSQLVGAGPATGGRLEAALHQL